MQIKNDILWRFYLCFLLLVIVGFCIIGKGFQIQQIQGKKWKSMNDSLHQHIQDIVAERGIIFSEDGQMLSASIPEYDLYMDFRVDYLNENGGKNFLENLDSLSIDLANLFGDKTAEMYKSFLLKGYKDQSGYFLLKNNVHFKQYNALKKMAYFKLSKYKSGLIAEENSIRLNPFKMLAFRTIGLDRDENKVGLELTYDSILSGKNGKRLVRMIAGGVAVPVKDNPFEIEPEMGRDIVCTIDTYIQEITENALLDMLIKNEAEYGCAIVMETKTGKIKAIANLGRTVSGNYFENLNYAITPSEPGSTFKLVSLMALMEDNKISLNNMVDLEKGTWSVANQTVHDSEKHNRNEVTVKEAFELSSNVGMSKLIYQNYAYSPSRFFNKLATFRVDSLTGIDLVGERRPTFIKPGNKLYGPTTLPWVAFGYNLLISPLQTLMIYNAVANNGKLLKPYLVSQVLQEGAIIRKIQPTIYKEKICSDNTIAQLKECLEGVCINGTAKELFKNTPYKVAGKTGTALIANGKSGYAEHIYQSSFAGYFPADDPTYSCIVVIKNKPNAPLFYGAAVAGPVFKTIANKLYYKNLFHTTPVENKMHRKDSTIQNYILNKKDVETISTTLGIHIIDSTYNKKNDLQFVHFTTPTNIMRSKAYNSTLIPDLKGLTLKDALFICENLGLIVITNGNGRVINQSIEEGKKPLQGQHILLELK